MTDTIDEINEVGPTIPNYNARPIVLVASREQVFRDVALAVSALKEIKGCIDDTDGLRHSVTGELLTDEWLFAYLRRAIDFRYAPQEEHRDGRNEKDGQVPEWLPDMIVAYGQDFSEKMWRHW